MMATYAEIAAYVRGRYGRTVKTCWIAHVKELNGLPLRTAPNRMPGTVRKYSCPAWARPMIEHAMRQFGMLPRYSGSRCSRLGTETLARGSCSARSNSRRYFQKLLSPYRRRATVALDSPRRCISTIHSLTVAVVTASAEGATSCLSRKSKKYRRS